MRLSRWQVFKIFWGGWCRTLRMKRPANGEQRTRTKDRAFHSRLEGVAEHDSRPGAEGRAELNKHQWGISVGLRSRAEEDNLTYWTPVSGNRHGRRRRSGQWRQDEGAAYRAANRDQLQRITSGKVIPRHPRKWQQNTGGRTTIYEPGV